MANNNLQQIKLGAPSSIEGGASPNAELSVQIASCLRTITLHDGADGTKCTSLGALPQAAALLRQYMSERDAVPSGNLSIAPLPTDFILNGGTQQLLCIDTEGNEVKCGWTVLEELDEPIGSYSLSSDGVLTIPSGCYAAIKVKAISFADSTDCCETGVGGGIGTKYSDSILVGIIAEYMSLIPIIAERPALASIIVEWPQVVNSLVETGERNVISNTTGAFFNTGVNTKNSPRAVVEMAMTNTSDSDYFGNSAINGSCFYANFAAYSLTFYRFGSTGSINTGIHATDGEWNTWDIGKQVLLDGNLRFTTSNSYAYNASQSPIYIYRSGRGNLSSYKIAKFNIYDGEELVRELVPFQRNGQIGLLDLLSNTFYENQGSGSFTLTTESK